MLDRTKKKKMFEIVIHGIANYDENDDPKALEFAQEVNLLMQDCLTQLQEKLGNRSFRTNSTLSNCEILGHSNKEYPDQAL